MDGNFSLAPIIFKQLYVIMAPLDGSAVSCIYALLPGKSELLYTEMLNAVVRRFHALGINQSVTSIVMDFEKGAINAARNVIGNNNLDITGCSYHLSASMWIQEAGLTQLYNHPNGVAKLFVGMVLALSYVPVNDVVNAYHILVNNIPYPALNPIIVYFGITYVLGRPHQQVNIDPGQAVPHNPPIFPPQLWNYRDITIAGGSRTNKICEGWNHAFATLVGAHHPPLQIDWPPAVR